MKISDLKIQFETELQANYSKAELEFLYSIFMEELFSVSKGNLRFREMDEINSHLDSWNSAIIELKSGRPYQYVLGSTEFYGLKLKLNSHTLIPRPETEELLDLLSRENLKELKSIADFGTGSGCIALGLKKIFPDADVKGFDVSSTALEIAKQNSHDNNLEVEFLELDLLKVDQISMNSSFDLILSNPPYVRELEKNEMDKGVLEFEPHQALFVKDENPLLFYEILEGVGEKYLNLKGKMYFEINQFLATETEDLFKSKFWKTQLIKDMSGNWRFLKVWK